MIRIKELREAKGVQQKDLAIDLGVTQPTISNWESGRKLPSAKSTALIADYFGVSVDYLLGREDAKKPTPVSEDGLEKEKGEWSTAWDQASPELRRAAMAVLRSAESHPDTQGAAPSDE